MASTLIRAYRRNGRRWFYLPDLRIKGSGGDASLLRYWGLLEPQPGEREDGSTRTGWWRITEDGVRFILGTLAVSKYAYVYDNDCLGHGGKPIRIHQALGKKFSYDELMNG